MVNVCLNMNGNKVLNITSEKDVIKNNNKKSATAIIVACFTFASAPSMLNNFGKINKVYSENLREIRYTYGNEEYNRALENMYNYTHFRKVFEYTSTNTMNEEVEKMLEERLKALRKIQTEFLTVSVVTLLASITGLIVFIATGKYIIHPSLYIVGILMGIGWGLTATTSALTSRRKNR